MYKPQPHSWDFAKLIPATLYNRSLQTKQDLALSAHAREIVEEMRERAQGDRLIGMNLVALIECVIALSASAARVMIEDDLRREMSDMSQRWPSDN